MANTYTQIYMHIIFAVSRRESLISEQWESELYDYISGACLNRKHHLHAIGGTADHVHLLVGMNPSESVSSLVQSIKVQSTKWINDRFMRGGFSWQSGFGAFSYSKSQLPAVMRYIEKQKEHHRRVTFQEELVLFFQKAGVEYHPNFLMKGFVEAK